MKKKFWTLLITVLMLAVCALSLTGCGGGDKKAEKAAENKVVRIGITGASDEVVWKPVIDQFKAKGVEIKLIIFSDYTLPNAALANKEIELNSFQHHKFLNHDVKTHGYKIEAIGDTMLATLNMYSRKIKDVKEIKQGDKIAVPMDTVNFGRALTVMQAAGLIKLKDSKMPEMEDIIANPLNLQIIQVESAQLAAMLPDVTAAIINGHYSADAGLTPDKDAIFRDSAGIYKTNDYYNVIVARSEDKDNQLYKDIVKAYQSDKTKEIYKSHFHGTYVPCWK